MSTQQMAREPGGGGAQGHFSAAQQRLEEVQLARLSERLRRLGTERDFLLARGEDPQEYGRRLAKQYAELSARRRGPTVFRPPELPFRLSSALDRLSLLFGWWQRASAPNATVGLTIVPTGPEVGGTGVGAAIYPGALAVGGEMTNGSTQEQWWINTWQYIVPLPATPANLSTPASLAYRFNVGASLAFYRQDLITGSVHVYVTVATTSDIYTKPIDFQHPTSSDFAIDTSLPLSEVPPMVGGTVKVTGSLALTAGGTPAIGILIGLICSVGDGILQILPGEFSQITLVPPDATTTADLGQIEYRIDQRYWIEAVEARLGALQQ